MKESDFLQHQSNPSNSKYFNPNLNYDPKNHIKNGAIDFRIVKSKINKSKENDFYVAYWLNMPLQDVQDLPLNSYVEAQYYAEQIKRQKIELIKIGVNQGIGTSFSTKGGGEHGKQSN